MPVAAGGFLSLAPVRDAGRELVGVALCAEIRRRKSSTGPSTWTARSRAARGGRFACRPVRRRPARRPRTSGRASRRGPRRQPVLPRIVPTSSGFASAMPTVERPGTAALARPTATARIGSDASPAPPAEVGTAEIGRSDPGGRRSVIGVEHFPARGVGGGRRALPSPPSSFGREHGPRVSRRASPCRLASVVSPQPEVVARPGRCRTPGQVAWAVATFARALKRAKVPPCHQVWERLPRNGDSLGHSIGL